MTVRRGQAVTREQPGVPRRWADGVLLPGRLAGRVLIFLPSGRPYYANREAVRLLGRGVLASGAVRDFVQAYQIRVRGTGEPYPAERLAVTAALAGHATRTDDSETCRPDGTVVPVEIWGTPVTGPDGTVEYAITAFVDVSERVRAQRALRASGERFRASVEVLPDGLDLFSAVRDSDGHIVDFRWEYINEVGCRLSQRTRDETIGHTMTDFFAEVVPSGLLAAYARVVETGEPFVRENIDYEDMYGGRRVSRALDLGVMKVGDGIVISWRDVSERRKTDEALTRQAAELERGAAELEERVRRRTADLERSNRELESLSYSIAHDLRTPLRAIHGYSQLLLDEHAGQLDEDGQALLGHVGHYTERMSQLIDDLLTLARIGRQPLKPARIEMTALVASVLADLRAAHTGRWPSVAVGRLRGQWRSGPDPAGLGKPSVERGEVQRGPAWPPSSACAPRPPARRSFTRCATTAPASTWLTRASCSGSSSACTAPRSPGPASAWPSSPASSAATAAGPGLRGTSAAARASPSPFRVRRPAERRDIMRDSDDIEPGGPVEILLVEDEPSDADLCLRALRRRRVANHIVWVQDGAAALDFLFARGPHASRAGTDRPRVVLLDLKLPKVDGFEVLRQIRADERLASMPVVVLTSSAEERDIAESYQLGVNSYISKPVNISKPVGFAGFQQAVEDIGLYWMVLNRVPETCP